MKQKNKDSGRLQKVAQQSARLGFVFVAIYAATTLIYRAWKLLPPPVLQAHWTLTLIALSVTIILWWFSKTSRLPAIYYQGLIFLQICLYISIATYSIYTQRGMASTAVILYAIPLIIAALSWGKKTLFATACGSALSYALATTIYFHNNPSEGYRVELYGNIFFYSAVMFLLASLLWVLVTTKKSQKT